MRRSKCQVNMNIHSGLIARSRPAKLRSKAAAPAQDGGNLRMKLWDDDMAHLLPGSQRCIGQFKGRFDIRHRAGEKHDPFAAQPIRKADFHQRHLRALDAPIRGMNSRRDIAGFDNAQGIRPERYFAPASQRADNIRVDTGEKDVVVQGIAGRLQPGLERLFNFGHFPAQQHQKASRLNSPGVDDLQGRAFDHRVGGLHTCRDTAEFQKSQRGVNDQRLARFSIGHWLFCGFSAARCACFGFR